MKVTVNHERAEEVLNRLLECYERQLYPYNQPGVEPPQASRNLPPSLVLGSREHAMFLFCLCYYMRGGIKSDTATKSLARLYKEHPQLFIASQAMLADEAVLRQTLKSYGLAYKSSEIPRIWIENAARLNERYAGDPIAIFEGVDTYSLALDRVKNSKKGQGFIGFQEKMVSMLTYFLLDAGMIKRFDFPAPVDFHVLRVMVGHEIVSFEDPPEAGAPYIEELLSDVRALLFWYAVRHQIDPLKMSEVIWLFSRALCSQYPGNQYRVAERIGRGTEITAVPLIWNTRQLEEYRASCGSCPVESTCIRNVPSAHYYVKGQVAITLIRQKPLMLFQLSELP